ncbi:MAG: LysM peptidoglycan-binding domain-containing protein, partial [Flavobacteriales bacterium]|nr:LysM peptidoglycan-binding domain-containing protein [Flavobacteriales bacterium]
RVMGTSQLYFPMFDEVFDKYEIPYEMRYLAIVESALNPEARSRAGAVGLWQFMFTTGKMYGLEINSYVDERRDPWKSTDAAARYLKKLYERFDDWNLALAAYNSGPGNVRKAIRRSGGKKDYWSIRPFLPRETRSYVPAFIAMNYVMNHAADHNIFPVEPSYSFWEVDTIVVRQQLKFDQVTAYTGIPTEELQYLNPTYRRNIVPGDGHNHILNLPVGKVGVFIANEDSIYTYKQEEEQVFEPIREEYIYRVRSGDVLGVIAEKHGVRVSELRAWNNIRGNTIYPGQKLVIYLDASKKSSSITAPKKEVKLPVLSNDGAFKYHVVQKGDTLWDIAKIYDGVTVDQLLQLNNGVNNKRLKPGQKIKVQKIS